MANVTAYQFPAKWLNGLEVKTMDTNERLRICDFCDEALGDPWFTVKACRQEGAKVIAEFRFQLCQTCYPKIHYPFRKAAFELMRQCLQEATAKIKRELQDAGKI